jgi:hypothetical protein
VFRRILVVVAILAEAFFCSAQDANAPPKPQVKVHILNVCTPSPEEQQEIASALAKIPSKPAFSPDFEVDRGRSVLNPGDNPLLGSGVAPVTSDTASADFVRIRHDFTGQSIFSTVQYSFSRDTEQMVETLVFRVRDPKDLLQISIDDSASAVTTPAVMLSAGTPANRIKLERFGKSSVVLARCPGEGDNPPPNQSAYEPLFASASSLLADYRRILGAKALIPEELAKMENAKPAAKPPAKKSGTTGHQ